MSEAKKKKRTFIACLPCQKAHLSCNSERPCSCCISRGCPSECVDGNRRKTKYLENIPSFLFSQSDSNSQQFFLQKIGFTKLLSSLKNRTWEGHIETKVILSQIIVNLTNILRLFPSEQISLLEGSVMLAMEEFSKMACIMPVPMLLCHISGKIIYKSPEISTILCMNYVEENGNIVDYLDDISILRFWHAINSILGEGDSEIWRKNAVQLSFPRPYDTCVHVSSWITVRKDAFQFPSSFVCTLLPTANEANGPQ